MPLTIDAIYDGKSLLPMTPLPLKPDTRVKISVMTEEEKPQSFLEVAQSLNVDGPPDWSENLDEYLYGVKTRP